MLTTCGFEKYVLLKKNLTFTLLKLQMFIFEKKVKNVVFFENIYVYIVYGTNIINFVSEISYKYFQCSKY